MSKKLDLNTNETFNKPFYIFKRKINSSAICILWPVFCAAGTWLFSHPIESLTANNAVVWLFGVLITLILSIKGILQVSQESLLIVSSVGIQLSTVYLLGTKSTTFIPWNKVHDVIVNEAVVGFRIVHYLAILTKEDDEKSRRIVPILLKSRLRLTEIKRVYSDIQKLLN